MKKHLFFAILLNLFTPLAEAQLSLQATIPSVGLIQRSQLWNVLVVNGSASSYECKLNLLVKDRYTGQDVIAASSAHFNIASGAKQLNLDILSPIQYNLVSPGIDAGIQGLMPVGSYLACYTLTLISGKSDLIQDCVQFDVEPLTLPMLSFPTDSVQLVNAPKQFVWTPPTPAGMFNRLHYEILITQINDGQKPAEAIQQNLPFYSDAYVFTNMFNYSRASQTFEKNKWYAWQVVAKDNNNYSGKSETWVFMIDSISRPSTIVEQTPFFKMQKVSSRKGIAPNGILKISYVNETSENIAQIKIINLSKQGEGNTQITVALQPGENLIQYNLNKKIHMEEGNVYEAQIINSRKEKWVMQFEFHKYKDTKDSRN